MRAQRRPSSRAAWRFSFEKRVTSLLHAIAGADRRSAAEGASQVWLWAVLDNLAVGGALNALALARRWLG